MSIVVFPQVSFSCFLLLPCDLTSPLCSYATVLLSLSFSGGTCRPHPYRKRPTLGNVSNQHLQQSYNLGYQDSFSPEYPSVHQVTTRYSLFRYINIKGTCIVLYIMHCCISSLPNCCFARLFDEICPDAICLISSGTPGPLV